MQDEKFTNSINIQYPSREDFIDIAVLNNNFRLLQEKKASIEDIEKSLERVAKEKSPNNIENNIDSIVEKLDNITKIVKIKNKKNFWEYPNKRMTFNRTNITSSNQVFLDIKGKGRLLHLPCFLEEKYINSSFRLNGVFKVEIDGEVQYKLTFENYPVSDSRTLGFGIVNKNIYTNVKTGNSKTNEHNAPIIQISSVNTPHIISLSACSPEEKKEFKITYVDEYVQGYFEGTSFSRYIVFTRQQAIDEPIEFQKSLRITYQGQNREGSNIYLGCGYIYSLDEI